MIKMKNLLILHGAGNNSQGNWFPWLRQELLKKGYKVWSPDMPNSNHPNLNLWLKTVFSNKDWQFNDQSILIGHSSGATFILRILENLPKDVVVDKAILVAGFTNKGTLPQFFKYKEGLLEIPFSWDKIKNSCKKFYFIHSDNDPYQCGQEHGQYLKEKLGGELVVLRGEGHFNLEASPKYIKFPEILGYI